MKSDFFLKFLFGIFLFSSLALYGRAQENQWLNQSAKSQFNLKGVSFSAEGEALIQEVKYYLNNKIGPLSGSKTGLKLLQKRKSQVGKHLTFVQTYRKIPIFGSSVKINLGRSQNVLSLFQKTANTSGWDVKKFAWENPKALIRSKTGFKGQMAIHPVIFYSKKEANYAKQVRFKKSQSGIDYTVIFNERLEELYKEDKNAYLRGPDTSITGKVFLPNPLKTAKKPYNKPFVDNKDANIKELNQERYRVQMVADRPKNDTFYLKGPYVKIKNLSAPTTPRPFSTDNHFEFKRDSLWFEDVNVYYHITRFQEYVQSLGFNNMGNYPVPVDAHATDKDYSWFSSNFNNPKKGKLYFGEGGVDDGEDAETIVHEYLHAISSNVAPYSNSTTDEAKALEEGLADYFTCSYSRHLNTYQWEKIFYWDAGVKPNGKWAHWPYRSCTTNKIYPDSMGQDRYDDGEIWAGTFMEVWEDLGRTKTDRIMLSALNSFSPNMSMDDAARLYLQADSLLNGKNNHYQIAKHLVDKGLVSKKVLAVKNDQINKEPVKAKAFKKGKFFHVQLNQQVNNLTVTLQTLNGKLLSRKNIRNVRSYKLNNNHLAKGVYLITLRNERFNDTKKVMK